MRTPMTNVEIVVLVFNEERALRPTQEAASIEFTSDWSSECSNSMPT
jgi:hypothetical protein